MKEWKTSSDGKVIFKLQDYKNSCFPACLQTGLMNIGGGMDVENYFNDVYTGELDDEAPSPSDLDCMLDGYWETLPKNDFKRKRLVAEGDKTLIEVKCVLNSSDNWFIIGAINVSGGHAVLIMKINGSMYYFNPQESCSKIKDLTCNIMTVDQRCGVRFNFMSELEGGSSAEWTVVENIWMFYK